MGSELNCAIEEKGMLSNPTTVISSNDGYLYVVDASYILSPIMTTRMPELTREHYGTFCRHN